MKNLLKKNRWIIHVAGCISFLALPIIFSPDINKSFNLIFVNPFRREFTAYVLLLGFFYINYYFLIKKYFFAKKYLKYFLLVSVLFVVINVIPVLAFGFPNPPQKHKMSNPKHAEQFFNKPKPPPKAIFWAAPHLKLLPQIFLFLIVLIFSLLLKINEVLKTTEKEKTLAELSYLKAQINPHFLFNTLNSIYSMALEKSDHTPTAVVKLAGIMRYIINETGNDFVPLEREIMYIKDYVDLQKFRFENTMQLKFEVYGDFNNLHIAPLLLIPFIENAFKYGVSPGENALIDISIKVNNRTLLMHTFNKKLAKTTSADQQNRIGLKNTRLRLESLYTTKHSLKITEDNLTYKTELNIELT